MKDLLLEKFENSMLVQKETFQILGGKCVKSSETCITEQYGWLGTTTFAETSTDYDDGTWAFHSFADAGG